MAIEVVKTIRASGGDYTSLSAFDAGEARDLVTADEIAVAEVYADWPDGLDDSFYPSDAGAWNTDATRKIIIRPAVGEEHEGVPGAGFWIRNQSSIQATILNRVLYMDIEGIEVSNAVSGNAGIVCYENVTRYANVKNCIVHDINSSSAVAAGAGDIESCLVYDIGTATGGPYVLETTGVIRKCTLYIDGGGAYSGQIIIRNCECYDTFIFNTTTGGYDNFYTCTGDYNASNDTSSPGSNSLDNRTLADFVDYLTQDFRTASDSDLASGGSVDFIGFAREETTILPIEFTGDVTSAVLTEGNLIKEGYLSGDVSTTGTVEGLLDIEGLAEVAFSGAISGSGSIEGILSREALLTGDLSITSLIEGILDVTVPGEISFTGDLQTLTTIEGLPGIEHVFDGSAEVIAGIEGALEVAGDVSFSGAIATSSSIEGNLTVIIPSTLGEVRNPSLIVIPITRKIKTILSQYTIRQV